MRIRLKSGLSIRYKTSGAGRTVLLLHPVGVRAEFWDGVAALLASEFRIIAADTRGHGESDAPTRPFTLEDCADDFSELLEAVGRPPALVAGCSMGGMIAQGIAARRPDLVAGLVNANTVHKRAAQSLPVFDKRAADALQGMDGVLRTTLSRWFDAQACYEVPEAVVFARKCLQEADPVVHSWSWLAIRDLNFADGLRRSGVPCLALAGLRDQATALEGMKDMATDVPGCEYREIDAGHMAPLESSVEFAAIVRDFARRAFARR